MTAQAFKKPATKQKKSPAPVNELGRTAAAQEAINKLETFLVSLLAGEVDASSVGYFPSSYNVNTNHVFTGGNAVTALLASMEKGDNRFTSFTEAKKNGWNTKGAKGVPFMRPNIKKFENKAGEEDERVVWSNFYLFNLADIEHDLGDAPQNSTSAEAEKIADNLLNTIEASGAQLVRAADTAHLSPSTGVISLPSSCTFKSWELFCSTCIHELSHFVGRDDKTLKEYTKYRGFEEIIAECTSVIVLANLGIPFQPKNAAYIKAWLNHAKTTHKDPLQEALAIASKRANIINEIYADQAKQTTIAA